MNVYLTFDIEVWCNGWDNLDAVFPKHFERYVFGRSRHGEYSLPKTLEILNRYDLKGVFFVEPLFAARFGIGHLRTIVDLIHGAGQEIQLHIHPEWTDEIEPPILTDISRKRQHLTYYTLDEQTKLIGFAKKLLEDAGSGPINTFRAGSFAANGDTYAALHKNSILYDSSLNRCYPISGPDLRVARDFMSPFDINAVSTFPVTVFKDGFGRERPAQIGSCSVGELKDALIDAIDGGMNDFVLLSHNFEMLKPDSVQPDWIVVRRFECLCEFLANQAATMPTGGFKALPALVSPAHRLPNVSRISTFNRHVGQLVRRLR